MLTTEAATTQGDRAQPGKVSFPRRIGRNDGCSVAVLALPVPPFAELTPPKARRERHVFIPRNHELTRGKWQGGASQPVVTAGRESDMRRFKLPVKVPSKCATGVYAVARFRRRKLGR